MFCEKQGVKARNKITTMGQSHLHLTSQETPAVMIYPPNPVPAFKIDGKLEGKAKGYHCFKLQQGKLKDFLCSFLWAQAMLCSFPCAGSLQQIGQIHA